MAAQRKAETLAAQGKDPTPLRNQYQRLTALTVAESGSLRELAGAAVAAQEASSRQSRPLIVGAVSVEDRRRVAPELVRLRNEAEAVERGAIDSLRARLGPEKFAQLDLRIRQHVVPNLKLYPTQPSGQDAAPGGR